MPADLYRDAHAGLRARLAELLVRLRERESEVTEAFWASLDEDVRERLAARRDVIELVDRPSLDELTHAEGQLAAYVDELEGLIANVPSREEEWRTVPDDVDDPPMDREPWRQPLQTEHEARALVARITALVRERDSDADVAARGLGTWVARFRERGVPFSLRATLYAEKGKPLSELGMCLMTSVPRAMPRLFLRHESVVLSFVRALGLKPTFEVGDLSFDGLFMIDASHEAARRLLVPNVQAQLLALARFDIPTLAIDPPRRVATLRWRFEPAPRALDAAVRVLTSIRATPTETHFTKA